MKRNNVLELNWTLFHPKNVKLSPSLAVIAATSEPLDVKMKGAHYNIDEHRLSLSALSKRFHGSSIDETNPANSHGLTNELAQELLIKNGRNELPAPRKRPEWLKYLLKFTDVFMIMLEAAAILSLVTYAVDTSQPANLVLALFLLVVVTITCTGSYLMERRSSKIMSSIQSLMATTCRVIRSGVEMSIDASELVTGDGPNKDGR